MSERDDKRLASIKDLLGIALILFFAMFFIAFQLKSEVSNLQRRVGQLEERIKQ